MTEFEKSIQSLLEGLLPVLKSPTRKVIRDKESNLCVASQAPVSTDPNGSAKFRFGLETITIGKYQANGRILPFAQLSETRKEGNQFRIVNLKENETFILSNWSKIASQLKELEKK